MWKVECCKHQITTFPVNPLQIHTLRIDNQDHKINNVVKICIIIISQHTNLSLYVENEKATKRKSSEDN